MPNIFSFNNFFWKKEVFPIENCEKLFSGHIWRFFRERKRLPLKIEKTFFITNDVRIVLLLSGFFKEKLYFLRKWQKTVSGGQVSFEENRCLATKMLPFFMANEVLNIFSSNNFFEKSNSFGENGEKNFGGGHDHFLREGVTLR